MSVALRMTGDLQSVEVDVMMSIVIEWLWCLVDKKRHEGLCNCLPTVLGGCQLLLLLIAVSIPRTAEGLHSKEQTGR